jgi:hypothetical protein
MQRNSSVATIAAMLGAASLASMSVGGNVEVSFPAGRDPGYRMGRRSRPQPAKGYAGAKLAKKASKGTLTHNGLR